MKSDQYKFSGDGKEVMNKSMIKGSSTKGHVQGNLSNCDAAKKDPDSGQILATTACCKNDTVHPVLVTIRHHRSASAAVQGYAAPTISSLLRMKLSDLPVSSPCQRYRPVEHFLPLCRKKDTSKTMTSAKPVHSKALLCENDVLKSGDGKSSVRMHPPNTTAPRGDERLSKWHQQGFHHPLQKDGLENRSQQFSTVPNSQLKVLKSAKGCNQKKVRQIGRAINLRKRSVTERQEDFRGIASKRMQTKRIVEKKTRSPATIKQVETCDVKKDPLFEQMVEEEQHRWLTEVKKAEDERKEFYCISENLRISFKVDWISYNISLDPVPADASTSTSEDLQNRKKDFTENLHIKVHEEKTKDIVFKNMNGELKEDSSDILETSVVEGLADDADRLSCGNMSAREADPTDDTIVDELSAAKAGTGEVKVNSQQKGHTDGNLVEEMLLTELEKSYFDGNSNVGKKSDWFDRSYGKDNVKDSDSFLCNDSSQLHAESLSPEFEKSDGQVENAMSPARSVRGDAEVKFADEISFGEVEKTDGTDYKESLLDVSPVKTENVHADSLVSREISSAKAGADDFEEVAVTFNHNIMLGYKVSCDAIEEDNASKESVQESEVKSEAGAAEGRVGPDVSLCDTGSGNIKRKSFEELSVRNMEVNENTSGKTGFERKDELSYVYDMSLSENERRILDSEIIETESAEGLEDKDSEFPVQLTEELKQNVAMDNLSPASMAKTEAGSSCLSSGHIFYKNQCLKQEQNSSEEDGSLQELCQRSVAKYELCQEDIVMQRSCQQRESQSQESSAKELDNVTSQVHVHMSSHWKSDTTGRPDKKSLHGRESNLFSLLESGGRDGLDKDRKQHLASAGNKKNVEKAKAASGAIRYGCANYLEDVSIENSDFHATVAVRDGTTARHSTTVDVVCLDVGSGRAPVTPLITLISDSISA